MKKIWKLSAGLLLAGSLFACPASAQPAGNAVARVTKISENGRLDFSRNGKTYQAYVDMKDFVNDKLTTDANTFGSIEFYTGGQIGINKNSSVEIISQNKVNVINVKSGGIWSKMSKQSDPLQIRTSSGVMGIKGTEFVVTETGNGTELAVLEGQVEVTPANGGQPTQVMPGTQVLLDLQKVEVVKQGSADDLRKQIQNSSEWNDFNKALQWASYITNYIPNAGGALSNAGYYSSMAVSVIDNPGQALADRATSEAASRIPGGGLISSIGLGGGKKEKAPDFPSNLKPDFEASQGTPIASRDLEMTWSSLKDAKSYAVLIARDEKGEDVAWTGQTDSTTLKYPSNAQPLPAGRYYWRVIGLDKKGKPVGKAAQTWFEAAP